MCPQAIKFLSAVDGRMSSLTTKKYFINKTMHFVHSCAVCAGAQELMRVLERSKITQYKKKKYSGRVRAGAQADRGAEGPRLDGAVRRDGGVGGSGCATVVSAAGTQFTCLTGTKVQILT
jgi:hypothetical protein